MVQAFVPQILKVKGELESAVIANAIRWAAPLTPLPHALAMRALMVPTPTLWFTLMLAPGLLVFGLVFAVNSSARSCPILAFACSGRASVEVGFYYTAHAEGRLLGTAIYGISYQIGGLLL